MQAKWIKICVLLFLLFFPFQGFCSDSVEREQLEQTVIDLKEYLKLITQITEEKQGTVGAEGRALDKQLRVSKQSYRNLLWQFADDLNSTDGSQGKQEHGALATSLLAAQSAEIKKEIDGSNQRAQKLENEIVAAKKKIFTVNQAVAKERLSDLQWKLYLKRRDLENLYTALVKNSIKSQLFDLDVEQDLVVARGMVHKQADVLSGLIGLNEDKLLKLEKKLSAVRSESTTGKKLLSDIAFKNLEIQDYANRLELMVDLMKSMEVDSSLYKKTVIQTKNSLNADIFDKRVISHLFTEWWLGTKKWLSKRAPTIISNVLTFMGILFIAYCIALVVKKMIRTLFDRINPGTSELAKKFIISMSSKIIILIGFLIALSNFGVQIGPILAGMGILGFIIGFALQETLSNFASGLMILIYRPYDVGDKIRVSGLEGKVSKMNLVSTTIFTSANHHLTVPNNKIWKDIIHNITSQPQVRLDLFFRVPFNADSETVLKAIGDEVESNPIVLGEKESNVRIYELGETEVKYIARFWVSSDDIDEAKWVISEGVKRRFDEKGISHNIIENLKVRAV